MKKLTAKIKFTNTKSLESAKCNFDSVQDDLLTLEFKWTNKNTTVQSFEKYVRSYLNFFNNMKRGYEILDLQLEDDIRR